MCEPCFNTAICELSLQFATPTTFGYWSNGVRPENKYFATCKKLHWNNISFPFLSPNYFWNPAGWFWSHGPPAMQFRWKLNFPDIIVQSTISRQKLWSLPLRLYTVCVVQWGLTITSLFDEDFLLIITGLISHNIFLSCFYKRYLRLLKGTMVTKVTAPSMLSLLLYNIGNCKNH